MYSLQVLTGARIFSQSTWRKPASKGLSTRAIQNYNNISTSDDDDINYKFVDEDDNRLSVTSPENMSHRETMSRNRHSTEQLVASDRSIVSDDMSNNSIRISVPGPDSIINDEDGDVTLPASTRLEGTATPDSDRTEHTGMGSSSVLIQSHHSSEVS